MERGAHEKTGRSQIALPAAGSSFVQIEPVLRLVGLGWLETLGRIVCRSPVRIRSALFGGLAD